MIQLYLCTKKLVFFVLDLKILANSTKIRHSSLRLGKERQEQEGTFSAHTDGKSM